MEKVNFDRCIEVPPIFLNSKLKENVIKLIENLNLCNQKDGYVSEICDIKNMESIGISRHTNFPIIRVQFSAITIKPEVGKVYQCNILQIYSYALVLEYNGPVKIIIPEIYFKSKYTYCNSELISENGQIVRIGDTLAVLLQDVKYSKGVFNCIASLNPKDELKSESLPTVKVSPGSSEYPN
jgi:DNA-directed RNA polymerase subunit E'/Rpb7